MSRILINSDDVKKIIWKKNQTVDEKMRATELKEDKDKHDDHFVDQIENKNDSF